jgi:hypothetical protein
MRKPVYLRLTPEEFEMLRDVALAECRDPREHARYLIRVGLGLAGGDSSAPVTVKCDGGDLRAAVAGAGAS